MTLGIAIALVFATCGCVCVCAEASLEFEKACSERGGQVQRSASSATCIVDQRVVATWVVDEEDGGS